MLVIVNPVCYQFLGRNKQEQQIVRQRRLFFKTKSVIAFISSSDPGIFFSGTVPCVGFLPSFVATASTLNTLAQVA